MRHVVVTKVDVLTAVCRVVTIRYHTHFGRRLCVHRCYNKSIRFFTISPLIAVHRKLLAFINMIAPESWILMISFIALIWYYVHRKWQFLKDLNVPHDPPTLFQLGHMGRLFGKDAFTYDNEMKKKHGPIWGAYSFLTPSITIHDPQMLRQIYIKEFQSFSVRQRALAKINGEEMKLALTSVEGSQWKRIRSSLTPTFSTAKLKQMTYIFDRCAQNAASALDRKIAANGGIFNSKTIFSRLSLDIICSAAFSTDVNSQDDTEKEPEIARQTKNLFKMSFFNPLILMCFLWPPFERVLEFFNYSILGQEPLHYFTSLAGQVINERRTDSKSQTRRVDLMQLMLDNEISEKEAKSNKLEKGMDKKEILGNAMLMILAGFENTGNTLSFLAYNLAQHPQVQTKVQEEIDETYAKKDKLDYEAIAEMKWLEMCVNETLRIYNPTLRNARICESQTTINGLTIPKGISINVPTFALSRDPEYWDEPEVFNPERMSDMTQIDPMVYQPFGGGPRNCIAMRFALMEIKLSMAHLLRQYTFEPTETTPKPPLKLGFGVNIRSIVDYNLRAVRRNEIFA